MVGLSEHDRAQPSSWMCQMGLLEVSPGHRGCWGMGLLCLVSQLSWGCLVFPRRAGWHSKAGQAHTNPSPSQCHPQSIPVLVFFPFSSLILSSPILILIPILICLPMPPSPRHRREGTQGTGAATPNTTLGDLIPSHSLKIPCPFPVPGRPQLILVPPPLGPAECAGGAWGWLGPVGARCGLGTATHPLPPGCDSASASSATQGVGLALQTTPVARGHPLPWDYGWSRGHQQQSERLQVLLAQALCQASATFASSEAQKAHGAAQGVPRVHLHVPSRPFAHPERTRDLGVGGQWEQWGAQ